MEIRPDEPARAAQKDTDARWTVKFTRAKPKPDGSASVVDLAIPTFGYKTHVAIDRQHGLIRTWAMTDAARHDAAQLIGLIDRTNSAASVWADYGVSIEEERGMAGRQWDALVHPPQEAARSADAATNHAGKRCEVAGALGGRAYLRPTEEADGVARTLDRNRPGNDEDRPGQSRLQHTTPRLWLNRRVAPA